MNKHPDCANVVFYLFGKRECFSYQAWNPLPHRTVESFNVICLACLFPYWLMSSIRYDTVVGLPKICINNRTGSYIQEVMTPIIFLRLLQNGLRYALRRSHGFSHPELTKSIASSPYYLRMTTFHHTEWSIVLFFWRYLNFLGNRCILIIDVILQPRFRNITDTGDASERDLFQEQLIDQVFGVLWDNLLLRIFNKLAMTITTFMILFAVMDTTIFDNSYRLAIRTN